MQQRVDHRQATTVLNNALAAAESSDAAVPDVWVRHTDLVGRSPCKTYVAVLGTVLLAKATNPNVDVFALKATSDSPGAYGPRMLSEQVLVPFAVDHRIHLGTRGAQPWNNQPWFRYDFANEDMRIAPQCREAFAHLLECFTQIAKMSQNDARAALAAFLRQRREAEQVFQQLLLGSNPLTVRGLVREVTSFINAKPEGGKRGQALVAAVFDIVYTSVQSGGINDPSRHWPGDVIVFDEANRPIQSCEVRQKPVTDTAVRLFVQALQRAGIGRGVVALLSPLQAKLERPELVREAEERYGVLLEVVGDVEELLRRAVMWSNIDIGEALSIFVQRMADRLQQVQVSEGGQADWRQRVAQQTRS